MSQDFLDQYLTCTSEDLTLIRPVILEPRHVTECDDQYCPKCLGLFTVDAVQLRCCGAIFHRQCVHNFATKFPGDPAEAEKGLIYFVCPDCDQQLDACCTDVLTHIGDSIDDVERRWFMLREAELLLNKLNKLGLEARLAILEALHVYAEVRPATMLRYSMLENKAIRLCRSDDEKVVVEDLVAARAQSWEALLVWLYGLLDPAELRDFEDWTAVPSRYGNEVDRFEPRVQDYNTRRERWLH